MPRTTPMTAVIAGILLSACSAHRVTTSPQSRQFAASERIALGGGSVLYVLDGRLLERSPNDSAGMPPEIQSLDAADIASIEVLKGELARERYGAAGENGVVLITTKRRD